MAEGILLVDRDEAIATVTINRPEVRNALNVQFWQDFPTLMRSLADDATVRVVVLRGAGEEAFASGADISEFFSRRSSSVQALEYEGLTETAYRSLESLPKPAIAMIYGFALGAGCELATACDFRLAADTARLGIPAAKLGATIGRGGVRRLVNLVGLAQAKRILLTGSTLDATEAKRIGLVHEVVPSAELANATTALARRLAENAPLSLAATKAMLNTCVTDPNFVAADDDLSLRCFGSEDFREGVAAFFERRKPRFVGR